MITVNGRLYYNPQVRDDFNASPRKGSKSRATFDKCLRITTVEHIFTTSELEYLEQFIRDVAGDQTLELVEFETGWGDHTMFGVIRHADLPQELRAKAERDRQRQLKQLERERAAMKANKNTIPPDRRP